MLFSNEWVQEQSFQTRRNCPRMTPIWQAQIKQSNVSVTRDLSKKTLSSGAAIDRDPKSRKDFGKSHLPAAFNMLIVNEHRFDGQVP
jgi:hypothetical protein